MLRLAGFFVLVLLALAVLRELPLVGRVFRVPLLGFWLTAILVSVAASKLAADALDRRRQRALARSLGSVETPRNQGKLGALLLAQGHARRAVPPLERAVAGEPDSVEWHYRLGLARLSTGDAAGATSALARAVEMNEEHAYGAARLRLAEARAKAGDPEGALEDLRRFEASHGPNPESAYRRGAVLRRLGRRDEARGAFDEVRRLGRDLAGYQRSGATGWILRASLARWVG